MSATGEPNSDRPGEPDQLEASHILDRSLGGPPLLWNGLALCTKHNSWRTRKAPYFLLAPEAEQRSRLWYDQGYSAVAAKLFLYSLVDTIRSWAQYHPRRPGDLKFRRSIAALCVRVGWALMDINFTGAAGEALKIAGDVVHGATLEELQQQRLCWLLDTGRFRLAGEFDSTNVESARLEQADLDLYVSRFAWRAGLAAAYDGRLADASGVLKDAADHLRRSSPELRHRVEIVRSVVALRRRRTRDAATHWIHSMVAEAVGDDTHPPSRPQTCGRILWLVGELAENRQTEHQSLLVQRLTRIALSCPIRAFIIPVSTGIRNSTDALIADPLCRMRHPSADIREQEAAVRILRLISRAADRVNRGFGLG